MVKRYPQVKGFWSTSSYVDLGHHQALSPSRVHRRLGIALQPLRVEPTPSFLLLFTDFDVSSALTRFSAKLRAEKDFGRLKSFIKHGFFKLLTCLIVLFSGLTLSDKLYDAAEDVVGRIAGEFIE